MKSPIKELKRGERYNSELPRQSATVDDLISMIARQLRNKYNKKFKVALTEIKLVGVRPVVRALGNITHDPGMEGTMVVRGRNISRGGIVKCLSEMMIYAKIKYSDVDCCHLDFSFNLRWFPKLLREFKAAAPLATSIIAVEKANNDALEAITAKAGEIARDELANIIGEIERLETILKEESRRIISEYIQSHYVKVSYPSGAQETLAVILEKFKSNEEMPGYFYQFFDEQQHD